MKHIYRFELVKGKPKEACPSCGKARRYVRYIDKETGKLLPYKYGRCDREQSCTYHLNPYTDEYLKDELKESDFHCISKPELINKPASYINHDVMTRTLTSYDSNNFLLWLSSFMTKEDIKQVCNKYNIGSSKHWTGSTVFWQIDNKQKVRSGKIMLFNKANGKRVKKPFSHINWVHKVLKLDDFNLKQCYFGEHLITDKDLRDVAIVESEKTAIIASIYLSNYIWLASGSLNGINVEKSKILKERTCFLFPDLGAVEKWEEKAQVLNDFLPNTTFKVSYLLEDISNEYELEQGCDLADFLPQINRNVKALLPDKQPQYKQSFSTFGEVFDFIKSSCPRLARAFGLV
ncbi:hypothetical protein J1N10_20580, partial [Carboxylicivirga sp. A043]|uniref:DUF6371 domain-containing protein n=1 Tax=Carboxylicivirga litoralis TaxID=2816963 RepID=UPI0021CB66E4